MSNFSSVWSSSQPQQQPQQQQSQSHPPQLHHSQFSPPPPPQDQHQHQHQQLSVQVQQSSPAKTQFLPGYHRGEASFADMEPLAMSGGLESSTYPRFPAGGMGMPPATGYYTTPSTAAASSPTYNGYANHTNKLFSPGANAGSGLNSSAGAQQLHNGQYPAPFYNQPSSYNSGYNPQYGSSNANVFPLNPAAAKPPLPQGNAFTAPSSSSAPASNGDFIPKNPVVSRYDYINSTISELTKITLEIEPLFNSNINPSKIPRDLVLKGFEDLQQLQSIYSSWLKYLNITDTQNFNKIEKQAVRTLSLMNNFENYSTANDEDNTSILESSSKELKSSPRFISESASSLSASLSSPMYNNKRIETKSPRSPKRSSGSGLPNSKLPSSFSSASSLDLNMLPMSSSAPASGNAGTVSNCPPTANNVSPAGYANGYGYGYGYQQQQQYHYQQYQYQPSLQILHEHSPITKYDKDSVTRTKSMASEFGVSNRKDSNTDSNEIITVQVASMECMHCSSKGTPEWRRGPDGERTLCNACGLFYSKLVKKYGEDDARSIMENRKKMGKCMDRRLSIT